MREVKLVVEDRQRHVTTLSDARAHARLGFGVDYAQSMSPETTPIVDISTAETSARPSRSTLLLLPEELLCIILACVADMEPALGTRYVLEEHFKNMARDQVLGWLRLSEVCARFRSVLLSMAALWARIAFELPVELGRLAIDRSKSTPLRVRIEASYKHRSQRRRENIPDLTHEYLCRRAIQYAARACSLLIDNPSIAVSKKILSVPLLQLEELRLNYFATCPVDAFQEDERIHVNAPAVRLAEFSFYLQPLYHQFSRAFTFRFPALVSFEANVPRIDTSDVQDLSWITSILQTAPLLERLYLSVFPPEVIDWSTHFKGRHATFSHLRSLELWGNPATNIVALYKHIGSPRPARCIVSCNQPVHSMLNDVQLILNFTNTFAALFPHPSHDGLGIEIDDEDDTRTLKMRISPLLEDRTKGISWDIYNSADIVSMSVGLTLDNDNPLYTQLTDIITRAIRGNKIKQLAISAPSVTIWPGVVEAIMSVCSAATELVVDHSMDVARLYSDFPAPATGGLLPALDTVFIRPQIAHDYYDENEDAEFVGVGWEACLVWLALRAHTGPRIRHLHIIGEGDEDRETYARAAAFVEEYADDRGM